MTQDEFNEKYLELYQKELIRNAAWQDDVLRAAALDVAARMFEPVGIDADDDFVALHRKNVLEAAKWAYDVATKEETQ